MTIFFVTEVRFDAIKRLIDFEEDHQWKIAPHLKKDHIELGNYGKMKVGPAKTVLSRQTGAAIRFAVKHCPAEKYGRGGFTKEDLTTAFFCEVVDKYFTIMDNHKLSMALSLKYPEKYHEAVEFLGWFMNFYASMKLTKDQVNHAAKPSQKAVLLSTGKKVFFILFSKTQL